PRCGHANRTRHRHLMAEPQDHRIAGHLADLVRANQMTLVWLSSRVGVTVANLSILKNSHAKAVRFSTLTAICDALGCTPRDVPSLHSGEPSAGPRCRRGRGRVAVRGWSRGAGAACRNRTDDLLITRAW